MLEVRQHALINARNKKKDAVLILRLDVNGQHVDNVPPLVKESAMAHLDFMRINIAAQAAYPVIAKNVLKKDACRTAMMCIG